MKKTLITLVITGIVSSMLIGCSQGTEGNTTGDTNAAPSTTSIDAPVGNTPKAEGAEATNAAPAPADANK